MHTPQAQGEVNPQKNGHSHNTDINKELAVEVMKKQEMSWRVEPTDLRIIMRRQQQIRLEMFALQ